MANDKRSKAEAYIIKFMSIADPSGFNVKYYKDLFVKLSDKMFHDWMVRLRDGTTRLYLYAPNGKVRLTTKTMMAAANFSGAAFEDKVKVWDEPTKRYCYLPHTHITLKLPVRRLKQYQQGKTSIPDDDRVINNLTGQVISPDKGSSISLTEAQTLDSKGLHKCLTEFYNVRGGNVEAYNSFRSELMENGSAKFSDLNSGTIRSVSSANSFLKAMHIDNNL